MGFGEPVPWLGLDPGITLAGPVGTLPGSKGYCGAKGDKNTLKRSSVDREDEDGRDGL